MIKTISHISDHLIVYTLVTAYVGTTVLGLLLTLAGIQPPYLHVIDPEVLSVTGDAKFWFLVLSPLLLVPLIAWQTRRFTGRAIQQLDGLTPDLSLTFFTVASLAAWAYILSRYIHADVVELFAGGLNSVESARARFEIGDRLGLGPMIVLFSILTFFSVFAVVKAARNRGWLWLILSALHIMFLFAALVLLNRKWPAVIFVLLIAGAIFVAAHRYRVQVASVVGTLGIALFFILAVFVYRGAPPPSSSPQAAAPTVTVIAAKRTAVRAWKTAPRLFMKAVMRMAAPVPYYYAMFTERGPYCGNIVDGYLKTPGSCQPAHEVYNRMFPTDAFLGRGTAPAAFHIYEYARGGWLGFTIALVLGSVGIGLFSALAPLIARSDLAAAMFVMGIYAAYFLSQLPIEGAIAYYHGLWWGLIVLLNTLLVYGLRAAHTTTTKSAYKHLRQPDRG